MYPLRQLLLTSYSPVLLSALPAEQLAVFERVTRISHGERSRVTRARKIRAAQPEPVPIEEVGLYVSEAAWNEMIGLDRAEGQLTRCAP